MIRSSHTSMVSLASFFCIRIAPGVGRKTRHIENDAFMQPPPTADQESHHNALALCAADCAERVLMNFEKEQPEDNRPRKAIDAARSWVRGELAMIKCREAAFAAHAAARETNRPSATFAARAAGHAAATTHVADHARHAAAYSIKSIAAHETQGAATNAATDETQWQQQRGIELDVPNVARGAS